MGNPVSQTHEQHRGWWQRPKVLMSFLSTAAVLYLVAPTGLQIGVERRTNTDRSIVRQSTVPVATVNPTDAAAIPAILEAWKKIDGTPIIMSYHDISLTPTSKYTVTPTAFAQQMAVLAAMGVHTMTASEFRGYTEGVKVPPRSILITFDDGARGVWKFADKVLEQHKFNATAFIITGFVGTRAPYYMTWNELDTLGKTGRWDFEAHTHVGHTKIPIDAEGHVASFVSNLAWLPEGRLETSAEESARVIKDLDTCIHELQIRGYGKGRLFAFPYSDYGRPSNNADIDRTLLAITTPRFSAVFADDVLPHNVSGPFQFNRLSIDTDVTPALLLSNWASVIDQTFHQSDPPTLTGDTTTS